MLEQVRHQVGRRTPALRALAVLLLVAVLPLIASAAAPASADPCGPSGNEIACENTKPGVDDDVWDVWGAGDLSIQGFATEISVNRGQRVDFKIDTDASAYSIDVYRMGYYQGLGARKVASVTPSASLPQNQPPCITEVSTELYDCGNWAVSASWNVPATAVSGVYIAKLTRTDTGGASHITFVVRNDASTSDVVFQTSDTTWHAYNEYGGSDFYGGAANGRAYKISYNRPFLTRGDSNGRDFFHANEYPMVRFLEKNGYDTTYISGVDTDRSGHLLTNHKVFLSVGHDEYWSAAQRKNVEDARDAGVHLQFLSGNEIYWKTRWEPSVDASRTPHRTLVSYKETWSNAKIDPSDEWTGTWRDPRFAPPSKGGGRPENALTGTAYMSNYSDLPVTVSAEEGKLRLWRHTSLASMSSGRAQLAPHTVGYESNEDLDNGHRPPGLVRLSTTTGAVPEHLTDFGNTVEPGTTTHHLTLYRASSGALVFSAGSVQWTWGLDEDHDSAYAPEPADPRMQQAQVNLFADMGVQPVTLAAGLVQATRTTDTTGPTVTITSPAAGAAQRNGDRVTVTGTATDLGGRVAGVEVSTDDGETWHAAEGTTSWSYSFIQKGSGPTPVRVRAADDSANLGAAATRSFDVSCPCSVFGQTVPRRPATNDTGGVELGLRFTPTVDGFVDGIRFYKGSGNGGTHVGSLWSPSGERLAQVTFSNETSTGWQTATFSAPVAVNSGQTYTASYSAPSGRYAADQQAFAATGVDAGVLRVAGGYGTTPAGVYGDVGTLPTRSWERTNYYVDVVFTTSATAAVRVGAQSPAPDAVAVPVTTTVSARYSRPVVESSARIVVKDSTGATVAGTTGYDAATRVVTFTPAQPLAAFVVHTVTVSGTDTDGNTVAAGGTWTFRTAKPTNPPGVCPCSLFDEGTLPTVLEDPDTVPVTLGTRFTSDDAGLVTGVRFYKSPGNTGTHTATLWDAAGAQLATGTFTGETANGWQEMKFSSPVQIARNTEYTVSYRTEVGRYSATPNAFLNADLSRPPLRVTSQAGAYTYGTGFPDRSGPTNYLVDVIFERPPAAIAIASQRPAPGAVDVSRGTKVTVDFTTPLSAGWSLGVRNGRVAVAGTAALDAEGTRLTWTPAATLPAGARLTVDLKGVVGTNGATLANQSWNFTTRVAEDTQTQTLFTDEVPQTTAAGDAAAVELGTAFTPARDGTVTAIRFYKGAGNGGTHTGSVWSEDGQRLATVTFSGETATGWQTAELPQPLAVTEGTTYVVSYFAPQGRYAVTPSFFAQPLTRGDLTAPATNNGRYVYGGGFPTFSYFASNYFVDVVFARNAPALTVSERTPEAGATGAELTVKPSLRLSEPLVPGWGMTLRAGSTPVAGTASLTDDKRTVRFAPSAPLAPDTEYTVSVTGLATAEGITLGTQTWSFRTGAHSAAEVTLFGDLVPSTPSTADSAALELGTAFSSSVAGTVTGVRFYKGSLNTGTHTGSLWSSTGTRLATVTFTGETSSGWQTARFATPVAIAPGQTYVVSYYAPRGRYASQANYFSVPRTAGPLTAPAGANGRYRYGTGGGFPANSYFATNYFVDVIFTATS